MNFTKTDNTKIINKYSTELYKNLTAPISQFGYLLGSYEAFRPDGNEIDSFLDGG